MPQEYINFFDLLNANGILFCSWKNNHELDLAFTAGSDLDLLIQDSDETKVRGFLKGLGWFNLINPAARFSKVLHYYKYDGKRFLHIHLYLRLWTGHSWLKEYDIPVVEEVLSGCVKDKEYGIPVPGYSHALALYRFRSRVKQSSVTGRFLYWRDRKSYASEYSFIHACEESTNVGEGTIFTDVERPLWSHPWLRLPRVKMPHLILTQFFYRAFLKFFRISKIIGGGGKIVVISGPDGAGKSTLVNNLFSLHKTIQATSRASLGRPYGRLINSLIEMRTAKKAGGATLKVDQGFSSYKGLKAIAVAIFRCFAGVRCRILRCVGVLVLSDRWPSRSVGSIDGPKIPRYQTGILKVMGRVERALYRTIPDADLAIILEVDVNKALSRNAHRQKRGKETDEELKRRYEASQYLAPKASRTIAYKNNGTLSEAVIGIERLISEGIA